MTEYCGRGIAIIGAACRMPAAPDLDALEQMLVKGVDAVGEIPENRWTKQRFFDPRPGQPGKTYSFAAGCLDAVDQFDAAHFGMSPREARHVDPQQRLLLELVQEAIEDAGAVASRLAGRHVGVFIGGSSYDYVIRATADVAAMDAYSMQGGALSSLSNRISYTFNLRGPSLTVDTACSSSLVALTLACRAIERGEVESAVVGGVNMLLTPQPFVGFASASMLSRRGRCHAFDARADGYVRGEGGGVILLKPLRAALADGDEIRGVILAAASNSDGRTAGLALPNAAAQEGLLRSLYDAAGIDPAELGYFEAHGTGTPVGDPIEAQAIGRALGRRRTAPLPIGSIKTNVGHLEAASFMAGLMKTLIALRRGEVPRSLHNEFPNPEIAFASLNLDLVRAPLRLSPNAVIGINSFGFGGSNAHAVVGPPPPLEIQPGATETPGLPLLVSGRTATALRDQVAAWRRIVERAPPGQLAALLRGAARKRDQHAHRLVATAPDGTGLAAGLDAFLARRSHPGVVAGEAVPGKVAFIYSGNGSQWAGMARDALAGSEAFRQAFVRVDTVLAPWLGWSVLSRIADADAADLQFSGIAQPLLFAVQYALAEALAQHGVHADMHLGHSVGEVAAACRSGALSLAQAARVITERSARQELTHGDGRMAVVGVGPATVESVFPRVGPRLVVSAINAEQSVTVSGPVAELDRLEHYALRAGWTFIRLDPPYAYHSPAMDPIQDGLIEALHGIESAAPAAALVSSVTGAMVPAGALDAEYWWRNVRDPVLFKDGMTALLGAGARVFVEIGPQPVLQSYIREAVRVAGLACRQTGSLVRGESAAADPIARIAAQCHALGVSISEAPRFDGIATARGLPTTAWQREKIWIELTNEALHLVAPPLDHPLLGWRADATGSRWRADIAIATTPWLADHAIDGSVVLPAAAMIDMALAAAAVRWPEARTLEILGLEISRAMPLDGENGRASEFAVDPSGYFTLSSSPRLDQSSMQAHATGRMTPGTSAPLTVPRLDAATAEVDAAAFYDSAREMKFHYGPGFQSLRRIRQHGDDCLEVELVRSDARRLAAGHRIDPAVLDGALQALLFFASQEQTASMLLPWRFGRIRAPWHASPPAKAVVQVTRRGPRSLCADITLLDAAGGVVLTASDCWFVALREAARAPQNPFFVVETVPDLRQPAAHDAPDPAAILARVPVGEAGSTVLLAETALASMLEAADSAGASVLGARAAAWAARDRAAFADDLAKNEFPDADTLWRSAFFDAPEAVAEMMLACHIAEAPLAAPEAASADLVDQMLTASPTARAALTALLNAVEAHLAMRLSASPIRLCLVGNAPAGFARRLLDTMATHSVAVRAVLLAGSAEQEAALAAALTGCAGAVVLRKLPPPASFDLVVGVWPHSATTDLAPTDTAALLASGGLALVVDADEGRLVTAARGAGVLRHDGRNVPQVAAEWASAGLTVAPAHALAGEVWPAALLAACRPAALPTAAPAPGGSPLLVAAGAPFVDLRERLPGARWFATAEALVPSLQPGAEALILLPAMAFEAMDERLAATLADLVRTARTVANTGARLWLAAMPATATDPLAAAIPALRRVIVNELGDFDCRLLRIDPGLLPGAAAAAIADELAAPSDEPDILFTTAGRFVPRLTSAPALPATPPPAGVRLVNARPGQLSGMAWQPIAPAPLAPDAVEIAVVAAGLNFRDVMSALGLLPDEVMLDGFSGPTLGLECAGIVTALGDQVRGLAVGDRVVAVAPSAIASRVVTLRHAVLPVPQSLDLVAAATLPVAFMTAIHALGHLARLRPGERVLVHGGAGGVGLAAVQYALHRGAIVYATAGTAARRAALRRLGVAGAFDSRSMEFADAVLTATQGEGVDVVLNSLSGAAMERSLLLLRPFGRFLEIGKRDLYGDSRIGLRPLRHNVSYFAIDADELAARRPEVAAEVLEELAGLIAAGAVRPLPYRCFGFDAVEDAFRLMQRSGHVGKILLCPTAVALPTPPPAYRASAEGVYVVTGGLAGFGLATARWLVAQGARHLALISRTGPLGEDVAEIIGGFARDGVEARAIACDVADPDALARALAGIRAAGRPIRGVVHAAMVLADAQLPAQDEARFATALRPKLAGALALDTLTRSDPVDLFLVHSSIATVIGSPGQANYAAANAAIEAVLAGRRASGLPALGVLWGPIGDTGMLARDARVSKLLADLLGAPHMGAAAALDGLPRLMQLANSPRVAGAGSASVHWPELRHHLPAAIAAQFHEQPSQPRRQAQGATLLAQLRAADAATARETLVAVIIEELALVLRLPRDALSPDRHILDLGLDSLMAVELRVALESRIGVGLPLLTLAEGLTLAHFADRLLVGLRGDAVAADDTLALVRRHGGTTEPLGTRLAEAAEAGE